MKTDGKNARLRCETSWDYRMIKDNRLNPRYMYGGLNLRLETNNHTNRCSQVQYQAMVPEISSFFFFFTQQIFFFLEITQ